MKQIYSNIQKHKTILWILCIIYLIFSGCFNFPFRQNSFSFILNSYSVIITAIMLTGLVPKSAKGIFKVFAITFLCITLGMICRYVLEYGEVSNIVNFTIENILFYSMIIPSGITVIYYFAAYQMQK